MKYLFMLALASFPFLASAQATDVFKLLDLIQDIIVAVIPVIIGLAVLVFVFGIFKYVISKSPEDQKEARGVILWGVIILFVMVSIWGLVNLLSTTIGLDTTKVPVGPAIPSRVQKI